jgi:hypothetical protein
MVFGLVAAGLAQGLAQSSLLIGKSKADSIAHKVAAAEMDQAHRIDYGDLGTVAGNPPGSVPDSTTKTVSNQKFKVDTTVLYVDDAALGQPKNYVNYKKVVVTVTPLAGTTKPVTQSTLVAPPSIGAVNGKSTVIASVVDSWTKKPLPNVAVTVDQSTSPPRTALTDAKGQVVFAGLEPSAIPPTDPKYKYRLSAALPGYVTHASTLPVEMQQHLSAKQTWSATIKMFKPITINVNLFDNAKGPGTVKITEAALTTLRRDAPVQSEEQFDVDGTFAFTQLAGGPIEPRNYDINVQPDCYRPGAKVASVPVDYPTGTVETVNFDLDPLPHGYVDVVIRNQAGAKIPGAKVQVSGGPDGMKVLVRATDSNGAVRYCLPPSVPTARYIVSGLADGYTSQSVLVDSLAGVPQPPLTLYLAPDENSCGISLDAGKVGQWVRLVYTGPATFLVQNPDRQTNSVEGGMAYYPNLIAGPYAAYYETGFSGGAFSWSPGVAVTCDALVQNKVIKIK